MKVAAAVGLNGSIFVMGENRMHEYKVKEGVWICRASPIEFLEPGVGFTVNADAKTAEIVIEKFSSPDFLNELRNL